MTPKLEALRDALRRITNLAEPPVVGAWYLVPTVRHAWIGRREQAWPVFLPKHSDAEHLDFPDQHYHVDPRFLDKAAWRAAQDWGGVEFMDRTNLGLSACQRWPLSRTRHELTDPPTPVWRRRQCQRSEAEYVHGDKPKIVALNSSFAGRQCKRARSGWVCPHQHFPMGSVPVVKGVQTCPLHGIRIRAADGVVLAPEVAP